MKLLMRTNSSNGDDSGNCDMAVIEFDDEYCKTILERMQFFREAQKHGDSDLVEMSFSDDRINCLSYEDYDLSIEQDNALNLEAIPIKVEDIDDGMFQRVECTYMLIWAEGVSWQCYPQYPDDATITISTDSLDSNFIESLIGKTPLICESCGHECPKDKPCPKCKENRMESGDDICEGCNRDEIDAAKGS